MVTYYKITTKTAFCLQLSNKMKVQLNTIFSVKWMFIQLYMFILVHVPMSGACLRTMNMVPNTYYSYSSTSNFRLCILKTGRLMGSYWDSFWFKRLARHIKKKNIRLKNCLSGSFGCCIISPAYKYTYIQNGW